MSSLETLFVTALLTTLASMAGAYQQPFSSTTVPRPMLESAERFAELREEILAPSPIEKESFEVHCQGVRLTVESRTYSDISWGRSIVQDVRGDRPVTIIETEEQTAGVWGEHENIFYMDQGTFSAKVTMQLPDESAKHATFQTTGAMHRAFIEFLEGHYPELWATIEPLMYNGFECPTSG